MLIEGNDDEAALFSLNDDNPDRTFSYTGTMWWNENPNGNDIDEALANGYVKRIVSPQFLEWQGSGSYRIASGTGNSNSRYTSMEIGVKAGTYIDFTTPVAYIHEEGSTLRFAGIVKSDYVGTWYNATAYVDYNVVETVGTWVIYPDRMAILVDGDVVTSVESSGDGTFQFDYEYPMTKTVSELGYRFYFDTTHELEDANYDVTNIATRGVYFFIDDNALAKYTVPDASTVVNKQILEQVKLIPSTIYNFFFGDSGDDAASGFKSDIDSAVSSVDQVQQEIVDGLDKPEPDTIVPDLEDVVPQEDYAVYTDIFAPIMQSSLFSSMMLVVVSMAFVSYVLFGKKG